MKHIQRANSAPTVVVVLFHFFTPRRVSTFFTLLLALKITIDITHDEKGAVGPKEEQNSSPQQPREKFRKKYEYEYCCIEKKRELK